MPPASPPPNAQNVGGFRPHHAMRVPKFDQLRDEASALAESRAAYAARKKTLKSDLKKSTGLIKKIKGGITSDMEKALMSDVETLNLTLYVSELVDAIAETRKTKDKDAAVAVAVCCGLHQRHTSFGEGVVAALVKVATDSANNRVGTGGFHWTSPLSRVV